MGGLGDYFDTVAALWPDVRVGNHRFYLDYLFRDTSLEGKRVLDIGAGDGIYSLYAAGAGARQVVALEPEAAGSSADVTKKFREAAERMGADNVELSHETFQEYDPGEERFDVVCLLAAVNHLDEPACMVLHRDPEARETYRRLFAELAELTAPGGHLIVSDASRNNLFARLPVTNPVARHIEWEKHQPPELWADLLRDAGFDSPRIRWHSFNSLRAPGRALLGNRFASWFLESGFCLTMVRA
ncbi:MAG TPA: class I SAM-dependent methyltransferase [Thermoleophilaceae bacterium]